MFSDLTVSKTVTVKRPASAANDYDTAWVEAFKGKGNTGDTAGTVNSYITVQFEDSDTGN